MTSSRKILVGLIAGVGVGLFFGERAAVLSVAAEGFVKLLQMTVLPYVTVSIVSSLGRLDYTQARQLGLRVGSVIAGLWAVALAFAFLIPVSFPKAENASFFSTTLLERREPFDFVSLYIPSNPFYSLANNIVPAVVLFSVLVGVALMAVERKQVLLDVLEAASEAISRATRMVTTLTPYGLFAIAATAAGTLDIEQIARLQIYLVSYATISLLVSLWVLPGLVATLTPVPLRDLLGSTRDALITAFVAGDLFIVLPSIIEASKALMSRHGIPARDVETLPDVIVPASFNLPHSGKLLSISFVLFAGWFSDASVPAYQYPQLALSGLVSFFGSLNAAVPFLLDQFRIPADTFQLFVATGVINSRFGSLLAAVHTLCVAVLGTCALRGLLTWERRKVRRFIVTTLCLTVVIVATTRGLFATLLAPRYNKDQILSQMPLLRPSKVKDIAPSQSAPAVEPVSVLAAIRARGRLRVGYFADALPYTFVNARQEFVGFDGELAHRLAEELGVGLEFIEISRHAMTAALDDGRCDIIMSGVAVTTERASEMLFSHAYLNETLALMMPDYARDRFISWETIRTIGPLTIGVPDIPYFIDRLAQYVPNATLKPMTSIDDVLAARDTLDAVAVPAERGSAYTLLHPAFSVVVPQGDIVKIPLAFPVAKHDERFVALLNVWIDLKRDDGTIDELFRYWILGQNAVPRPPRWSIARNVLGWVD